MQKLSKGFNQPDSISDMIKEFKEALSDDNENTHPQAMAFGGMIHAPKTGLTPGKPQYPGEAEITPSKAPVLSISEVVMPRNPSMKKPTSRP